MLSLRTVSVMANWLANAARTEPMTGLFEAEGLVGKEKQGCLRERQRVAPRSL